MRKGSPFLGAERWRGERGGCAQAIRVCFGVTLGVGRREPRARARDERLGSNPVSLLPLSSAAFRALRERGLAASGPGRRRPAIAARARAVCGPPERAKRAETAEHGGPAGSAHEKKRELSHLALHAPCPVQSRASGVFSAQLGGDAHHRPGVRKAERRRERERQKERSGWKTPGLCSLSPRRSHGLKWRVSRPSRVRLGVWGDALGLWLSSEMERETDGAAKTR